jgi:hypothetical protein
MGEARGLEHEETEKILARSVAVMLAASGALPGHDDLAAELACVEAADARGYFLPDKLLTGMAAELAFHESR